MESVRAITVVFTRPVERILPLRSDFYIATVEKWFVY